MSANSDSQLQIADSFYDASEIEISTPAGRVAITAPLKKVPVFQPGTDFPFLYVLSGVEILDLIEDDYSFCFRHSYVPFGVFSDGSLLCASAHDDAVHVINAPLLQREVLGVARCPCDRSDLFRWALANTDEVYDLVDSARQRM